MKYELEFDVEWFSDGHCFNIDLEIINADQVKIFDDNGVRIGNPKNSKNGLIHKDENAVKVALEEAEVHDGGYSCAEDGDPFYIGPVLFDIHDVKGDTHTLRFTSEDVEALKRDGGVEFREAELNLEHGIRRLLHLTNGNTKKTKSRFTAVLNRILAEEVMTS